MAEPTGLSKPIRQGSGERRRVTLPGPVFAGMGRLRKIAILGNHRSLVDAPFDDPSWELWAHTSTSRTREMRRTPERYFDLHGRDWWELEGAWKRGFYVEWLQRLRTPIFMQEAYRDIPAAIQFPKERILAEFRRYFTSQTAWMIALALTEGVTHLGLFGIAYEHYTEYATQRAGAEYWLGFAEGRGVQIVTPKSTPILRTPWPLYGYQSHVGGTLHEAYKWSPPVTKKETAMAAPGMQPVEMDNPKGRPPLRDLGEPIAWNRSGHIHQC